MNINKLCQNIGPALAGPAGPVPPALHYGETGIAETMCVCVCKNILDHVLISYHHRSTAGCQPYVSLHVAFSFAHD